jgi:hypothetical protein
MSRSIAVQSARDLGPLFKDNPHRMIGQDGAFSIALGKQTLWYFGDTLMGERRPRQSLWFPDGQPVGPHDMSGRGGVDLMINNSGLLVPAGEGPGVLQDFRYICNGEGRLRTLLPLEGEEHPDCDRIWCQHGVSLGDERVCLSFIKVQMTAEAMPPLPLGFHIIGSGLAVGSTRDWAFRRVEHGGNSILWPAEHPRFGVAFLPDAYNGYTYVYGTAQREGVYRCFVARVQPEKIDRPDAYEYLVSPAGRWGRSMEDASPIFDRMPSELSISYNPHLRSYMAVHSLDLTGRIVGRTAPNPWGPWSEPADLWHVNVTHDYPVPYPTLIYAGKEHPELAGEGGRRIYLTYIEFEEYFPHLVEVTLA